MNEDQPSIEHLCLTIIVIVVLGSIGVLAIAFFEAAQPGQLVQQLEIFMLGLLDSLVDLTKDVAKVVAAPVEVAVDLAGAVVKPVAEAATELVKDVKSLKD